MIKGSTKILCIIKVCVNFFTNLNKFYEYEALASHYFIKYSILRVFETFDFETYCKKKRKLKVIKVRELKK
jgi:hypothetical protein